MSSTAKTVDKAGHAVVGIAKHQTTKPWLQMLERFGFVIRGVIYIVVGFLALLLAIGAGGAATSPTSAITLIGKQPFGMVFLAVIAVGLTGYSLWGLVRAFMDPYGLGTDRKGLMARFGYLLSGLSYGLLLIPTLQTLLNKSGGTPQTTASGLPAALTAGPTGKYVVILFGLIWVGVGIGQWVVAYKASFMRYLKKASMTGQEVQTALTMGKIGYVARGVVFALVGVIILQTVFHIGVPQAQGFDGALAALAHAPYGGILLGAVALGLIVFGAFSCMCAKWSQIGTRR